MSLVKKEEEIKNKINLRKLVCIEDGVSQIY